MLGNDQSHVETQSYGTASYAAPELLGLGKLTTAADIYSLAIISEPIYSFRFALLLLCMLRMRAAPARPPARAAAGPACPGLTGRLHRPPAPAVWELVAGGQELYPGLTAMQVIVQVSQQQARPDIPEDCPPDLAELMQRCWHKDPAQR